MRGGEEGSETFEIKLDKLDDARRVKMTGLRS
jgi:hypothetical protein